MLLALFKPRLRNGLMYKIYMFNNSEKKILFYFTLACLIADKVKVNNKSVQLSLLLVRDSRNGKSTFVNFINNLVKSINSDDKMRVFNAREERAFTGKSFAFKGLTSMTRKNMLNQLIEHKRQVFNLNFDEFDQCFKQKNSSAENKNIILSAENGELDASVSTSAMKNSNMTLSEIEELKYNCTINILATAIPSKLRRVLNRDALEDDLISSMLFLTQEEGKFLDIEPIQGRWLDIDVERIIEIATGEPVNIFFERDDSYWDFVNEPNENPTEFRPVEMTYRQKAVQIAALMSAYKGIGRIDMEDVKKVWEDLKLCMEGVKMFIGNSVTDADWFKREIVKALNNKGKMTMSAVRAKGNSYGLNKRDTDYLINQIFQETNLASIELIGTNYYLIKKSPEQINFEDTKIEQPKELDQEKVKFMVPANLRKKVFDFIIHCEEKYGKQVDIVDGIVIVNKSDTEVLNELQKSPLQRLD